jgi:sortase A
LRPEVCDTDWMQDVQTRSGDTVPAPADAKRQRRRRQGRILQIVGGLLLIAALAIAGWQAWELWGTGLATKRAQADLRPAIEAEVATKEPADAPPREKIVKVPGNGVALLVIPRMDLDMVLVEGTGTEALKKGPGHYSNTAYPWEDSGRVGIAGHRTTYGAPFWSLDKLRPGDRIILKTEYGIFDYSVTRTVITDPSGTLPSGSSVLAQTNKPTLVLTTCNPRFSAAERMIVFARRTDS